MENIISDCKSRILHIYDLKGSSFDRQSMKDSAFIPTFLKDMDFQKLEKGVLRIDERIKPCLMK